MIVCTSICANYLPKAMVLAKSLKAYNPNVKIFICLIEKDINKETINYKYFDGIILAKDLGVINFEQFIFRHSIVEAATAVKGQLFKFLMNTYKNENKFVYLDPDIKVFGELKELDEILENNEIVLTPHIFQQEKNIEDVKWNELNVLKHGLFNLGFLGIRRGDESNNFIHWWSERLSMFCYDDIPNGIFTDQRWVDLAVCFFNVYILKHPGYNLAPWNYSSRKVTKDNDNYLVNNEPLRFLHFSGFDSGNNIGSTQKYILDNNDPIYIIRAEYSNDLKNVNQELLGKSEWSYDFFNSGERVNIKSRIIYRENDMLKNCYRNPFEHSNDTFTGILKEIDDALWEKKQSEISLDNRFVEKMRFDLSLIKKKFIGQKVNYVLWGAGGSGVATEKIIRCFLPNFKLICYIDGFKTGKFNNVKIYKKEDIKNIKFDFVIISTSVGKVQAEEFLKNLNYIYLKDYIYGYGV